MKNYDKKETAAGVFAGIISAVLFLVLVFLVKQNFFVCLGIAVAVYVGLSLLLRPVKKIGGVAAENFNGGFELLKQFVDYYQETAVKLLSRYKELEASGLRTNDVLRQRSDTLNGGKTVDESTISAVLPKLKEIFSRTGYMETSSSDLFNQFLRMGVGAKPIIAGYESQILEYAAENPAAYEKIKDDVVVIYPSPTVWSTHIYIALDDSGKSGIEALVDEEVQRLAWEKHGFRTGDYSSANGKIAVSGIPENVTAVMNMPSYNVMKKIIDELS